MVLKVVPLLAKNLDNLYTKATFRKKSNSFLAEHGFFTKTSYSVLFLQPRPVGANAPSSAHVKQSAGALIRLCKDGSAPPPAAQASP